MRDMKCNVEFGYQLSVCFMRGMKCNVEFGYQLSVCFMAEEYYGKP
jgi:hypothetical protein